MVNYIMDDLIPLDKVIEKSPRVEELENQGFIIKPETMAKIYSPIPHKIPITAIGSNKEAVVTPLIFPLL